ncbi:DUF1156 domain-containing protein [Chloroflexi bacterium]|nr:DUF1156 domain-containing protein [Chloroflexota bacterium]
MEIKKKIIEVALPLDAINKACMREKSLRHGHISTLHLYWARRPLASARAAIFASLIDDPSNNKNLSESEVLEERDRIFKLIEELVLWENENDPFILEKAKKEIEKSTNNNPPIFLDPFAGGGAIPYEAQKLGLNTYASDLNPISAIINKAQIEIPYLVKNKKPINPKASEINTYSNSQGLADDFEYYANIVYEEAFKKLSQFYPSEGKVIGWIWARNLKCSNPTCESYVPLLTDNVIVRKKKNKKTVWLKHYINGDKVDFKIMHSDDVQESPPKVGRGSNFKCYKCGSICNADYIKEQANNQKIGFQMIAKICDSKQGRFYTEINVDDRETFIKSKPDWSIDQAMDNNPTLVSGRGYGIDNWKNIFLDRQMLALTVFTDEIKKIKKLSVSHGANEEYANCILVHLSMCFDRFLNRMTTFCRYHRTRETIEGTLGRQYLPMVFDFAEVNPFSESTGSWKTCINWGKKILNTSITNAPGYVDQIDAGQAIYNIENPLIVTDPPYYDNIQYATLSDFYYVWLRNLLKDVYPDFFKTIVTPKNAEITANKHIYDGDAKKAKKHFLDGLANAADLIAKKSAQEFPIIYYYAYKQTESDKEGTVSTGWETFLEGLIKSNCRITATWPIRTEMVTGLVQGANMLSSSILIAVRQKNKDLGMAIRSEFINELNDELKIALKSILNSNISPVDVSQAMIGPGMSIFTKYAKILESDGRQMTVKTALALINSELDKIQEDLDIEMDSETRFCLQWFDTYGFEEQPSGEAEKLAMAKNISVQGLIDSGIFEAGAGKAQLKNLSKMDLDWDPRKDDKLTLWECTHHMIKELEDGTGQLGAARLAKFMGEQKSLEAKELAYKLFHICNKKQWFDHLSGYNTLILNWEEIKSQISNIKENQQGTFF